MNLHQFRFVQEAARRNLNLTEAAKALHTSQPGVSKAIIELEQELGIDIFARHGKRLKRITEPGQHVLKSIEVIMREIGNLKKIGDQYSAQNNGTLYNRDHAYSSQVCVALACCQIAGTVSAGQHQLASGIARSSSQNAFGRHSRNRNGNRIIGQL